MNGQILVMTNIKPRKLADFMSNGMIMAVENK
jgi:tRNA-binding EMAP/Myf-like protein